VKRLPARQGECDGGKNEVELDYASHLYLLLSGL
jgi:hypothetical protein